MVNVINGGGAPQNLLQSNRSQAQSTSERQAQNDVQTRETPDVSGNVIGESEAQGLVEQVRAQLEENQQATIGNGQIIDQLL